ncbi:MAG: NTP transferase domain-containing protein [Methanobacterium sp.]|nr:NTP transferase domain-containing protein [Methanobacterium sp.]
MNTAVIMAGGKGTRMKSASEKPLIMIRGKPMIQYVHDAASKSVELDRVVVATSKHTPHTTEFCRKKGYRVIETPGEGYVEDLGYIITNLPVNQSHNEEISSVMEDEILVTITSDLPFICNDILDEVIREYKNCGKPSMCVAVPVEFFTENNLKPHMVLGDIVPSGLNILRRNNNQQDEEVLELRKFELALNINSPEDLISLEKYLSKS